MNHLENFDLSLEHDDGHEVGLLDPEIVEEIAREKIVIAGDHDGDRSFDNCSYIWVEPNYAGQLSPGQWKTYELLLSIQSGTVYTMTTVGKLAEAQDLQNPLSCYERLGNLQSLGAIHGFKG